MIHFTSKRQKSVALSTCEAEYVGLSDAAKAIQWITQILTELGLDIDLPVRIHEDNKAVTDLIRHPGASKRTRHIDIRYHHVQELHAEGFIKIIHVTTKQQHADWLTKTLPRSELERIRDRFLRAAITDKGRCP